MDKKTLNNAKSRDFDYTIVLDSSYISPVPDAGKDDAPEDGGKNREIDRLYARYEFMCLQEPTILDADDAYPHTYYWRLGDRYDPSKIEVVKAALSEGKKIADTEAYAKYVESVKNSNYKPESWE